MSASAERGLRSRVLMPALFVLIWSTGFVVARLAMPHAPPLSFLALRFLLSAMCLGLWVMLTPAAWPADRAQWLHLVVLGLVTHALYLGCGWAAVKHGMGAGTMALIAGLQPLLTALWQTMQGERLRAAQWAGLMLGLAGLALVVGHKLGQGEVTAFNLMLGVLALLAISGGALYQKRFIRAADWRVAMLIQLAAAALPMFLLGGLEGEVIDWRPQVLLALAWSVLALTLGASSLFYLLLERGEATRVSTLLYLVPPGAALLAWALFSEALGPWVWLGMALSALGVFLVIRRT